MTSTPTQRLLAAATEARTYWARVEASDPARARSDRKWAASKGWASEFDDPCVRVRSSDLLAVCGGPPPEPDPDQLEMFEEVPHA